MKNKYIYTTLFAIFASIHFSWLNIFGGPLTDGDFFYIPQEALKTVRAAYFTTWLSDFNFGRILIDLSQAPTYFLPGIFANLFGLDYSVSERLVYFIPILFFGFYGSYKLFSFLFNEDIIATSMAMCVYLLNTYAFTLQTGHITLAAAYAIFPLAFYFFASGLLSFSYGRNIISILLFVLLGFYETRLLFLSGIILLFLFAVFIRNNTIKVIKYFLFSGFLICLLNLFWIFPLPVLNFSQEGTLGRNLFGHGYWTLQNALTLHQSWWNFSDGIKVFVASPTHILYFVYPIIFIIGTFLFFQKNKNKIGDKDNLFLFGIIISLVGIFLGKMTQEPFGEIYPWLYSHIPFFNAFREPTKFYLMIAIGYSFLIGFVGMNTRGFLKKSLFLMTIIISGLNVFTQLQHNKFLLEEKDVPTHYQSINNIIKEDKEFGRIMWVPRYERWGDYSFLHPPVNAINGGAIDLNSKGINLNPITIGKDFFTNIFTFFNSQEAEHYLHVWNIAYVVLPEKGNPLFKDYGGDQDKNIWEAYFSVLKQQSFLEEISHINDSIKIFKVVPKSMQPRIIFSGYNQVQNINYTQYKNRITISKTKHTLTFLESFHPEWKIYLEPYSPVSCDNQGVTYSGIVSGEGGIGIESYHVTECPSENRLYAGGELAKLWQEPIFDDTHKMVYDYANQWTIDPEYIRANYSREYYRMNPDGTMDVRMTLYFRPQSYFYLGLIISGLTLFGCVSYLVVSGVRGRRRIDGNLQK